LGTAQFGLRYGITNAAGQVDAATAALLLQQAQASGVRFLDTAQAYGTAEQVLGAALPGGHSFRLISKLPAQPPGPFDLQRVAQWQQALQVSLQQLRVPQLDALLLHASADLARADGSRLLEWLLQVQEQGLVRRIGVSIYCASDLDLLPLEMLQLVQLPCSLYDQRLIENGTVERLHEQGIAIHARSLYLQGLLVTPAANWPATIAPALRRHHQQLQAWAQQQGRSLVELALCWARRQPWLEAAVLGITSPAELQALLQAWRAPDPWLDQEPRTWAWPVGEDLDPRRWT
jgi:aryl-alcohol dehydrogenase-like predicted oxidoreductase